MKLFILYIALGLFTVGYAASADDEYRAKFKGDGYTLMVAIALWPVIAGRLVGRP